MSEWIDIKQKFPSEWEEKILVKTDCEDCPVNVAFIYKGKMHFTCIIQCDYHYETDEKFHFLKVSSPQQTQSFVDRVTHWISILEEPRRLQNETE